ncbi:hypothetical protein R3P38DRAFT_1247236 [Favolaschia claudopus]|uniref:Zn(2)-C6 fungal-type domain-containing protein n=1 Tax=Favolaschia claudopus TaxID=2862362 RepID=A0AAW0B0U0_9AGAR
MKRAAPSSSERPTKRTKASQACTLCRRQKSRCEILDRAAPGVQFTVRCHRCKVLGLECSFETSDLIHFNNTNNANPPSTSASASPGASASSPAQSLGHSQSASTPSSDHSSPINSSSYAATTAPNARFGADQLGGLSTLASVASSRPVEPSLVPLHPPPLPSPSSSSPTVPLNVVSGASQYGMSPQDLIPTATTPVWGTILRVDWTATPMLAMQELIRCPARPQQDSTTSMMGVSLPGGTRLSDILSGPEIQSLLEIFETRYTPWLAARLGPLQSTGSLLDIVRCTIASRHLEPSTRSSITPQLQKLTEEVFLREIFNPQPTLDSVRALLILSVWTPICGTGGEARDGRLLIASAVSMAMNLQLQDASKRVVGLRGEKGELSVEKEADLHDSTEKWRMWMYLSLSESILCIGTGRKEVSQISQQDRDIINISSLPPFTIPDIRDHRLGIIAKFIEVAQTALRLRLKSLDGLETFFDEINTSIRSMEGLTRVFAPLPVITKCDAFYSQMLVLQHNAYKLLMIHHALRETRTTYEREAPGTLWYAEHVRGQCLSLFWGHTALTSAETVLSSFLAVSDSDLSLLTTAPDNMYVMIGFAATWIFVTNYTFHQLGDTQVGGASEVLQRMCIERLGRIAGVGGLVAPDCVAGRCGVVLGALMTAWERRRPGEGEREGVKDRCSVLDMSYAHFPVPTLVVECDSSDGAAACGGGSESGSGGVRVTGTRQPETWQTFGGSTDLFMDDAFWSLFLENMNSDSRTMLTNVNPAL